LLTAQGCDSIIVLTVTIKPTAQTNITQTICQGSSVVFNGNTLITTGVYKDTLSTSLGCDSIITLSLIVNPVKQTTQNPVICQGNTITVGTHTYSVSGIYKDTLRTSLGCDSIVTTNLTVTNTPQAVSIVANKNPICQGEAVRFTATALNPAAVTTYQWFLNGNPVGANSSIYNPSGLNSGDSVYVQIQSAGGCTSNPISISNVIGIGVDSINFTVPSVSYCAGENGLLSLNISPSNYSVLWQNGTSSTTTVNADTLRVNNTTSANISFTINYGNGCNVSGVVPVVVFPSPNINATVNNPVVTYDEEVQLDVQHSGVLTYNWSPAGQVSNDTIKDPTAIIRATTLFTVEVRDLNNCRNSDTVWVLLVDDCQSEYIYLPTAFSPNGDGVNDCFRVVSPPALSDFKLLIFNRWGEKLFETTNPLACWDGTYKGADVMGDSYVFLVSFKCSSGEVLSKKGTVSVVK
jgi:gliding motility-associated-like protein